MKVIHVCQSADPNVGGSLVVARALAAAQNNAGIDAWVFYLYRSPNDSSAACEPKTRSLGIERVKRYTSGIKELYQAFSAANPDLIHHHDGLLWPRLASGRLRVPLVTHGHLGSPKAYWPGFAQIAYYYARKHTDRLIAVSQSGSASWVASGFASERVRLVPHGVDTIRFRARGRAQRDDMLQGIGLDPCRQILLWAGRLDRKTKGLDRLVRVLRSLPDDWSCLVGGDGADRKWLENTIDAAGMKENSIALLGKLDTPELWFGISNAFLFTSYCETFGLVLLEAAASELPIIAFPCEGGGKEILDILNAEMLTDNVDLNLGRRFRDLLERAHTRANRRLVEEQFSWGEAARKTIQVYQELLEERAATDANVRKRRSDGHL